MADYEWILTEDIRLREDGAAVLVIGQSGRTALLTYQQDVLLIDTEYIDVGDDLPRFLGIMDAASEGITFIGAS